MALTSNDIVNAALQYVGNNQPAVGGQWPNFDTTGPAATVGKAANLLYGNAVKTVGRQFGWDFARHSVALALTDNTAPFPWAFEYLYPNDSVEIWQLLPATLADPNNPLPIRWNVGNVIVDGVQKKVIWSNLATAHAYYNNNPTESTWDSLFVETLVRLLASELSMATAGRPDTAQSLLDSGSAFETLGETRPD